MPKQNLVADTPPNVAGSQHFDELASAASARLPELNAMARYYALDDALDEAIRLLQAATHRNVAEQAMRDVGLSHLELLLVEKEAEALCEYAALRVRKSGRTALERVMTKRSTPGPETDAGRILRTMAYGRYRVGWIAMVKRGVGIVMFDLIRGECVPVTCPEIAGRDSGGALLATRTIEVEGFMMTTGAPLSLFDATMSEIMDTLNRNPRLADTGFIQGFDQTPEQEAQLERQVLTSHYRQLLG